MVSTSVPTPSPTPEAGVRGATGAGGCVQVGAAQSTRKARNSGRPRALQGMVAEGREWSLKTGKCSLETRNGR